MKSLYEEIQRLNPRNHNVCITVIPEETGKSKSVSQKALIVDGEIRWVSEGLKPWLDEHISEFVNLMGAGILEVDGSRLYYEQLSGSKKLVICGAGHVGLAVIRQGKLLHWHVTVIDDREEFRAMAIEAGADEVMTGSVSGLLAGIPGDLDTCFVIATRAHLNDLESLKIILKKEYAYVGLMGSRRKTVMLKENLRGEGYQEEDIRRIHMPIGLKIGAETPAEIAVAILGEIIQVCSSQAKRFGYPEEILRALCDAEGEVNPLILATVIRKEGSAPRGVGSKMLLYPDGRMGGTVGGGKVEALTIEDVTVSVSCFP